VPGTPPQLSLCEAGRSLTCLCLPERQGMVLELEMSRQPPDTRRRTLAQMLQAPLFSPWAAPTLPLTNDPKSPIRFQVGCGGQPQGRVAADQWRHDRSRDGPAG
jgi:hypothetical protein